MSLAHWKMGHRLVVYQLHHLGHHLLENLFQGRQDLDQ